MAGPTSEKTRQALDDAYAAAVASAFGTLVMRISGSGGETADAASVATFKKEMRIIRLLARSLTAISHNDPAVNFIADLAAAVDGANRCIAKL